jgi:cation diffusion facilitator CzcD-associated flavoprotein CzcO
MILTTVLGITGQFFYWLLFEVCGFGNQRTNRKLNVTKDSKDNEYYALIIGSGFSGLGMAIKLKELGTDNFVVIERHGHVGGTWYANTYPGCACDVPSNLYSFSFEPNPNWSYFFGRQPEIGEYLEHCTDKYDIRRHVQFNTKATQLKWLNDRQLWEITTQSSDNKENIIYARFVMAGYGPLSNASYPTDISGIDKFEGEMCHTAEWKKTINFENKRVAVVGTGASAIQVVPEIGKAGVTQLLIFQRTAPWITSRLDQVVSKWQKRLLTKFPIIQKLIRSAVYWVRESRVLSLVYRLPIRYINEELVKYSLRIQVKDEELRKKLTPTWDLGCKRILLSDNWYSTIQKPNVKLVTDRIQEIKPNSIVTNHGEEYPVDIIIWSTGFLVQKFPLPLYGSTGVSLTEQWSETMQVSISSKKMYKYMHLILVQAYRGVTVPNFPNLFLLLGPNTGLAHNSVIVMIEAQIQYISEALLYMQEKNLRTLDVKQDVYDQFNKKLQAKLKKTVWQSGGCHSWYQDAKGNNTTIWPDFTWIYILLMKSFDSENYILQS